MDDGLESYNTGKAYGSNAKWINLRQPWRFINGNFFTDWKDEETGLSRAIVLYGGILVLGTVFLPILLV